MDLPFIWSLEVPATQAGAVGTFKTLLPEKKLSMMTEMTGNIVDKGKVKEESAMTVILNNYHHCDKKYLM